MTVKPTTRTLPLLPLTDGVVLPEMVVTIALETAVAQAAAEAGTNEMLLVPQIDGRYALVGAIATIEDRGVLPNGTKALTLRITGRARLGAAVLSAADNDASVPTSPLWVETFDLGNTEQESVTERARELAGLYRTVASDLLSEMSRGRFAGDDLPLVDDPGALADTIGYWPELSLDRRVLLLETVDVEARIELALSWATEAHAQFKVSREINDQVAGSFEQDQREAILRRQLTAIRKELGEIRGDGDAENGDDSYQAKLADLEIDHVGEKAYRAIAKEVERLEQVGDQNMEASWIRSWLDTVFEIPWTERAEDDLDLRAARSTLDADHTGLDEVKDRIVEFLAVRKLRAERISAGEPSAADARDNDALGDDATGDEARRPTTSRKSGVRRGGAILTLVGPPGVGKTSLGQSIADALGRPFVRMALGGIRDEAEIRGHRRTYVGARPGRLVRALNEAGAMNPVILLDEIDKLGGDLRGDPSAALLEVLDPAQNHSFRDNYLEFELDLSDVIFIATANRLDTISGPLLDRVEVIQLDGYTNDEKETIARDHILPRLRSHVGLRDDEVVLDDDVLGAIVADWTREAGVRSLERQLDKLLRKGATKVVEQAESENSETGRSVVDQSDGVAPITVDDLTELLGRPIPRDGLSHRSSVPGVATGLAVTGVGGDALVVEAAAIDGKAGLTLTGQLGEVMQESGEIARSWLLANAADLGLEIAEQRFHVHFPAGATPKDGPSAGITMATALVSVATGRAVRSDVGMTGEISLRGRVLPIGGVKQKLLAAHREGLTTVIIPARNGPDLDDVPDEVRADLTVHLVDTIDEVLDFALVA